MVGAAGTLLTVMVKLCGVPVQPFAEGVTVIVATAGVLPLFIPLKAGISPVPEAASPMLVLLLVQLKVVPLTAPEKLTAVVLLPLHTVWSAGSFTVGVGFTVMVKD
jgi:hypothetical protein